MVMNEARQNLLASAGRPIDEDSNIGLGNPACQPQKVTADLVSTGNGALV